MDLMVFPKDNDYNTTQKILIFVKEGLLKELY